MDKQTIAMQYLNDVNSGKLTPHRRFSKLVAIVEQASATTASEMVKAEVLVKAQDLLVMMHSSELIGPVDKAFTSLEEYIGQYVPDFPTDFLPPPRSAAAGIFTYPLHPKPKTLVDGAWTTASVKAMLKECGGKAHVQHFDETVSRFIGYRTEYLEANPSAFAPSLLEAKNKEQIVIERFDTEKVLVISINAFKPSLMETYANLRQAVVRFHFDINEDGSLGSISSESARHMIKYTCCNVHVNPK